MPYKLGAPWTLLVVALFCLPLFIGLGRVDLGNDESIYSFAVDRMLETTDWLFPRSSPNEDWIFLEKPPLKMWIVAAPIRLGLLPHNEFGLRFWDALFGAIGFLYVLFIGRRLAGPICGAAAVLILFVHDSLVFEHGLRSNNMEAALFLSYCGGIHHYLAWMSSDRPVRRRGHALAVTLYFVLGFMTKFVAALFLPLVLGAATLLVESYRAQFARNWRAWAGAGVLALVLIVPWFAYAWLTFGDLLWERMVGEHLYTRFTSFVDPGHVNPWHFYLSGAYRQFANVHPEATLAIGLGLVLLIAQTLRRRWPEGVVVLLWFGLPVALMSLGTSKLYHYLYPFLPPLALAGGYAAALVLSIQPRLRRMAAALDRRQDQGLLAALGARGPRLALGALGAAALVVAAATALYGPIYFEVGDWQLFRNSRFLRPTLIGVALLALGRRLELASRLAVPVFVLGILPVSAYAETLARLPIENHPMRSLRDCLLYVRNESGHDANSAPALYLDVPDHQLLHPVYYYFRRLRPWERAEQPSDAEMYRRLYVPANQRPVLVADWRYDEFMQVRAEGQGPPLARFYGVSLLLPGPYAVCAAESGSEGTP